MSSSIGYRCIIVDAGRGKKNLVELENRWTDKDLVVEYFSLVGSKHQRRKETFYSSNEMKIETPKDVYVDASIFGGDSLKPLNMQNTCLTSSIRCSDLIRNIVPCHHGLLSSRKLPETQLPSKQERHGFYVGYSVVHSRRSAFRQDP